MSPPPRITCIHVYVQSFLDVGSHELFGVAAFRLVSSVFIVSCHFQDPRNGWFETGLHAGAFCTIATTTTTIAITITITMIKEIRDGNGRAG